MPQFDIGTAAARAAEDIEAADSAEDAGLIGDNVLDVRYTIGTDGRVRDVHISYNSRNARITVDARSGALTASAGMDTHRVHVDADAVLRHAAEWWEMQIQGNSVRT